MSLLHNLLNPGGLLGGNPMLSKIINMAGFFQKLQQFSRNPIAGLLSMVPNVEMPTDITNAQQAVQHLIDSGQMTKEEFQQYGQTASQVQTMFPRF